MEETLTPQERKALIESIKNSAIERNVLHHYGLSEKEAETFGAFEEASLTAAESYERIKEFLQDFFTEGRRDRAMFRCWGDRP